MQCPLKAMAQRQLDHQILTAMPAFAQAVSGTSDLTKRPAAPQSASASSTSAASASSRSQVPQEEDQERHRDEGHCINPEPIHVSAPIVRQCERQWQLAGCWPRCRPRHDADSHREQPCCTTRHHHHAAAASSKSTTQCCCCDGPVPRSIAGRSTNMLCRRGCAADLAGRARVRATHAGRGTLGWWPGRPIRGRGH
jgi:hypothetical protein